MKKYLLAIVICGLVVSCSPKQEQFKPEFNKESVKLEVTVVPHKSRNALNRAYNSWVGVKNSMPLDTERLGWSTWTDASCTIHIDVSQKEKNVREYFQTLGHEYAHCLYGKFHN